MGLPGFVYLYAGICMKLYLYYVYYLILNADSE